MATKAAPAPSPTANGVAWNFTPPPVTTFAPGIGADLGQAVLNAPLYNQQQQEASAQADAGTAEAQAAKMQAQNTILQQMLPVLRAKPDLINSPTLKAVLAPILASRGIPYPTLDAPAAGGSAPQAGSSPSMPSGVPPGDVPPVGGAGSGNAPAAPIAAAGGAQAQPQAATSPLASFFSMFTPPQQTFQELSGPEQQEYVSKALLVDPSERVLMPGAPDWLKTARQLSPISQPVAAKFLQDLSKKEESLFTPKSAYTSAAYLADVKSLLSMFRQSGNADEVAYLKTMLSPDETALSDSYKAQHVTQAYELERGKLDQLGIHLRNEDEYRAQREKDLRAEFDGRMQFNYANLAREEKRDYNAAQNASNRINVAQGELTARLRSIDDTEQRYNATKSQRDFAIYKGVVAQANQSLQQARAQLATTSAEIDKMSQNPALNNSPAYKALLDQATTLKTFLDEQGPILQARANDAAGSAARIYQGVSDNPSSVPSIRPVGPNPFKAADGTPLWPAPDDPDPTNPQSFVDYAGRPYTPPSK